jgi:hypothetical protein
VGDVGLNRRLVARALVAVGMGLVAAAAAVQFGLAAALLAAGVLTVVYGLLFVDVEGRR